MKYVADQKADGLWYVREESEMRRNEQCREWSVSLHATTLSDGGEWADKVIAKAVSNEEGI